MKKRADGRYRKVVDGKTFYGDSERELYKKILEFNFYFIYHAHFDIFVKSFVFCNAILQLFQIVSG